MQVKSNTNKMPLLHHNNDPANNANSTLAAILEIYNEKLTGVDGDAAEANRSVVAPEALSFLMRSSQRPVTV